MLLFTRCDNRKPGNLKKSYQRLETVIKIAKPTVTEAWAHSHQAPRGSGTRRAQHHLPLLEQQGRRQRMWLAWS